MRKLKSLVCGSKFGQFYIDAISKMKECVEFIGIFSNGSERSRLCAEKYNVNLYTSLSPSLLEETLYLLLSERV